jgi:hypothetical protein
MRIPMMSIAAATVPITAINMMVSNGKGLSDSSSRTWTEHIAERKNNESMPPFTKGTQNLLLKN